MLYNQKDAPSDVWMQTYTGKRFYPLAPRVEDIDIEDIAHHLSLQCRYAGACREFYSVAEHSVRCSLVGDTDLLEKLLHDSAEAYLQDMIRPLKQSPMGELYLDYEDSLAEVIAKRFGLQYPFPPSVKEADNILLFTEKRDLTATNIHQWAGELDYIPLDEPIYPWHPTLAEQRFLARFAELTDKG